jgi:uncharacterized protein YggE
MRHLFTALALLALLGAAACSRSDGTLLTVVAEGEAKAAPDVADLTLGVTTEGQSARAAMQANAQRMTALIGALGGQGVAERDVQTSYISVQPEYSYGRGLPRIRGYQASNNVSVRVRKLDNLGAVLDAAVAAGGNTIQGVNFGFDKPDAGMDAALKQATQRARERANVYAEAAGMRVRRIVSISEGESVGPTPYDLRRRLAAAEAADGAPTPTQRGEVRTNATVTVVFELR